MLEPVELQARVVALDDERPDRRPAHGAVERGPDDDQVGAVAGGDEDLLAVEHVLVAVEVGGGADRGRVRARFRLGDRHRRPLAAVFLELLLARHRGDRGVAEALSGHRQQQADVAPAELDDAEHGREVGAVAVLPVVLLAGVAPHPGGARRAVLGGLVHAVDQRGEHVELFRVRVLGLVVLAGDRAEDLGRHLMGLAGEGLELLRCLEIDHGFSFARGRGLDEQGALHDARRT